MTSAMYRTDPTLQRTLTNMQYFTLYSTAHRTFRPDSNSKCDVSRTSLTFRKVTWTLLATIRLCTWMTLVSAPSDWCMSVHMRDFIWNKTLKKNATRSPSSGAKTSAHTFTPHLETFETIGTHTCCFVKWTHRVWTSERYQLFCWTFVGPGMRRLDMRPGGLP